MDLATDTKTQRHDRNWVTGRIVYEYGSHSRLLRSFSISADGGDSKQFREWRKHVSHFGSGVTRERFHRPDLPRRWLRFGSSNPRYRQDIPEREIRGLRHFRQKHRAGERPG